jgi:DNA polymerase-1
MEYGSLDNLLQHADAIKGVAGENLRQAREWLPTGRQLVTMKTDCDLSAYVPGLPALEALHLAEPDKPALKAFYETYGFKGLARALSEGGDQAGSEAKPKFEPTPGLFDEPAPAVSAVTDKHYDCVLTWDVFEAWLSKLQAAELVAFDTETT